MKPQGSRGVATIDDDHTKEPLWAAARTNLKGAAVYSAAGQLGTGGRPPPCMKLWTSHAAVVDDSVS